MECWSHGWLKVEDEEKTERGSSSRESLCLGKDSCPPFYKTRGARYMGGERKRERGRVQELIVK
jgi:hypothetical protein